MTVSKLCYNVQKPITVNASTMSFTRLGFVPLTVNCMEPDNITKEVINHITLYPNNSVMSAGNIDFIIRSPDSFLLHLCCICYLLENTSFSLTAMK